MSENKQNTSLLDKKFSTQASLAHIHKLSSVGLLVGAGLVSLLADKPLHSELYILLGTYISSGSNILDFYFGNKVKDNINKNEENGNPK